MHSYEHEPVFAVTRRALSPWVFLGCVLAAGIGACGDDDDDSAPTKPTQDVPTIWDVNQHWGNVDAGSMHDAGRADAGQREVDAGPALALCSGCPSELIDPKDDTVRVHHVHLNTNDARAAMDFYVKHFGAKRVRLNDKADALWAEPLLFLFQEGTFTFSEELKMGFEHVGMGVKDPSAWFEQASKDGVMADTRNGGPATPASFPLTPGSSPFFDPDVDTFSYIYVRAPNGERVEVWSGLKSFRHAHFMTPDIDATVAWYQQLLGLDPLLKTADDSVGLRGNAIAVDGVQLNFLDMPVIEDFIETDDQAVSHLAFSVQDLDARFAAAKDAGAEIVSEPADTEYGFRSFFVRAPEKVLLEFVAAGPVEL